MDSVTLLITVSRVIFCYTGLPFTLSEVLSSSGNSRVFFTVGDPTDDRGEGTIVLPGPGMMAEQNMTVYVMVSCSSICCSSISKLAFIERFY